MNDLIKKFPTRENLYNDKIFEGAEIGKNNKEQVAKCFEES